MCNVHMWFVVVLSRCCASPTPYLPREALLPQDITETTRHPSSASTCFLRKNGSLSIKTGPFSCGYPHLGENINVVHLQWQSEAFLTFKIKDGIMKSHLSKRVEPFLPFLSNGVDGWGHPSFLSGTTLHFERKDGGGKSRPSTRFKTFLFK